MARALVPVLRLAQRSRASQFDTLGAQRGAIVFLGDSITEAGLWSERFPAATTSNRGIGGERTAQMLARLGSAIDAPRAVFFLGGTNDLAAGESVDEIAARTFAIVDEILLRSPGCPVVVQSVMPRKAAFAAEIMQLNRAIRLVVARPGR